MTRYVAFLRAVNVGKRRVEMARLRAEFEALGFEDVTTHINSGNVIFSADATAAELEPKIEARLEHAFGFEVITFVRTAAAVRTLGRDKKMFAGESGTHMVAFLRARPSAAVRSAIEALSSEVDVLRVRGSEVHWLIRGSFMDSKLKPAALVKAAGDQPNTARNSTMLSKLAAKLTA